MFKSEGPFRGKIIETMLSEAKFNKTDPGAFDVCLKIQGPDHDGQPQIDWWSGEISGKYGTGNFATKTQSQITMEDLAKIGFQGQDLTQLDAQLKGKEIDFFVKSRMHDGKTYYDVKYIGGSDFGPKALSPEQLAAKLAAFNAGASQPPAQGQQSTAPGEADSGW